MSDQIIGFRLSPQQKRLWRLQEGSSAYHARCIVRCQGKLDTNILREAIQRIVDRHEILRTTFYRARGMTAPIQVVARRGQFSWVTHSVAQLNPEEQTTAIDESLRREASHPFDLEQGPLLRAMLIERSEQEWILVFSLPSLCADVRTLKNILAEVRDHYAAGTGSDRATSEALRYVQFAEVQNDLLDTLPDHPADAAFPSFVLSSAMLPFERSTREKLPFGPRVLAGKTLSAASVNEIDALAQAHGVTASVFLLTCWYITLQRWNGSSKITVGVHCENRTHEKLQNALGLFATYFPVTSELRTEESFIEALGRVKTELRDLEHREHFIWWGGVDVADTVSPPHCYVFEETVDDSGDEELRWSIGEREVYQEQFKVLLQCLRVANGIELRWHYDENIHQKQTVDELAAQFNLVVNSVLQHPRRRIDRLELMGQLQREQVARWNETEVEYSSEECLHELVAAQVERTPEAVAVIDGREQVTYAELNRRANQLAHYLQAAGVGPEELVGICLGRSVSMVVAVLAVLKAGGAYVPLDPEYPRARVSYMLGDAEVRLVLTERGFSEGVRAAGVKVVELDEEGGERLAAYSDEDLPNKVSPENLAYVIYTSGSTGRPKGVMVTHLGVVNYLGWATKFYEAERGRVVLLHSSLSFDLTITSLFAPLLAGQRLLLVSSLEALAEALCRNVDYSLIKMTPSHLQVLSGLIAERRVDARIGVLILGGEALSGQSLVWWGEHATTERIINEYGPTETVVGCSFYDTSEGPGTAGYFPIGKPIANVEMYLLDEDLEFGAVGPVGEIHIGGVGLARGYFKRPDLTAERFLPNPYSQVPGARMFRSGDLGRRRWDGILEFVGRADGQVKTRGHRVECGEVEAVLREQRGVRNAVAALRENKGHHELVAYVVPEQSDLFVDEQLYQLPNGLEIAHANRNETQLLYQEIFLDQAYFKNGISLVEGDCVFDVGANIGLFTLFVQQRFRDVPVYAFEPVPPLFNKLRSNVALYGLNSRLFNCAVSNTSGTSTVTYYPRQTTMSGLYTDAPEDEQLTRDFLDNQEQLAQYADDFLSGRFSSRTFPCVLKTISEVISEHRLEQIGLLKVDVEKSELDVLRGINEEDWRKIRQIVIEVHNIEGRLEQITSLLKEKGYEVITEQEPLLRNTSLYTLYATREANARQFLRAEVRRLTPLTLPGKAKFIADLREGLQEKLPAYMMPAHFFLLDELPLMANGKVDRSALLAREIPSAARREFVPPETHVEKILAGVWAEVLGVPQVGVTENFFELGGDSILSVQVVAGARKAGLDFTPKHLFENQTIRQLAALSLTKARIDESAVPQVEADGALMLTPIQRWFFEQELTDPHHFNQAALLTVAADCDAQLCKQVLNEIQLHHEALRLRFVREDNRWRQYVAPHDDSSIPFVAVDLSELTDIEQQTAIETTADELHRSLDLSTGPLWRATFFRLGASKARLLIVVHHLAIDGVSLRILLADLQQGYRQLSEGRAVDLVPATSSFRQWTNALREYATTPEVRDELTYWVQQLEAAHQSLPRDTIAQAEITGKAMDREVCARLSAAETHALLTVVPRAYQVGITDVLLTALAGALSAWIGPGSIVVDVEGHGREFISDGLDTTRTIGWFTTIYPAVLKLGGVDYEKQLHTMSEYMRNVPRKGIGYGILRYLNEASDAAVRLGAAPQAEMSFNYLGQLDRGIGAGVLVDVAPEGSGEWRSARSLRSYLLEVDARVLGGELRVRWNYSEATHNQATVEKLAYSYMSVLRALIALGVKERVAGDIDLRPVNVSRREFDQMVRLHGPIEDIYDLSPAQKGILFHVLYAPHSRAYYVPLSCTLEGNLRVSEFRDAWLNTLQRHPVLRTAIGWGNSGEPLQIVYSDVQLPWTQHDWRGIPPHEQSQRWESLLEADRDRGFDLSTPPLLRLYLAQVADSTYQFLWSFSHLILDGWSVILLLEEVFASYGALCERESINPPRRRQYREYVRWLRDQDLSVARSWWQTYLENFKPTYLAGLEDPHPTAQPKFFCERDLRFSIATTSALQSWTRQHHLTLNTVAQGAWSLLLRHYTGKEEVVFGATVSGRPPSLQDSDQMVGLFINTLPVITRISGEDELVPWLTRLQAQQAEARQFQDLSLAEIQKCSGLESGQALFDSLVVFENYPVKVSVRDLSSHLTIRNIRFVDPSHYPVTLTVGLDPEFLLCLTCDSRFFGPETIRLMLEQFRTVLTAFATGSDLKLKVFEEILSETERRQQRLQDDELKEENRRKLKEVRRKGVAQH